MTTILNINTSLFGDQGLSSRLAQDFVAQWQARHPAARLLVRELAANPIPHLTAADVQAFGTPAESRNDAHRVALALSDELIDELRAADVVVIGLPMYNFGVPSGLKAYFDHVARAGVTFRYTAEGPQGLLQGKRVYVFATRGGRHAGTPSDVQSAYVRQFLGFLGMTDVEFVYVEGLALGDAPRTAAIDAAGLAIEALAA